MKEDCSFIHLLVVASMFLYAIHRRLFLFKGLLSRLSPNALIRNVATKFVSKWRGFFQVGYFCTLPFHISDHTAHAAPCLMDFMAAGFNFPQL